MPPLRLAIFLASLAATGVAQSYVASPSIYEKCEGPSQNTFPFTGTFHYQQFHTDLVGTPRVLTGIGWRRDGLLVTTTAYPARVQDLEISMGDTTYATVTSTFATNYASPPSIVYARKSTSLPDIGPRSDVVPSPWTFALLLDTPYLYLGLKDLAYEVTVFTTSLNSSYFLDAVETSSGTTLLGGFGAVGTGCTTSNGVMKLRSTIQTVTTTNLLSMAWGIERGPSNATSSVLVGFGDPALQINLCNGELVHTDATLMALPVTTSPTGTAATPAVTVPFQLVYTVFTLTAQAASLDASQPLGLAVSNGIASIVPPLLPLVAIGRIYASGAPAATFGTLSMTSGLVTRFRY